MSNPKYPLDKVCPWIQYDEDETKTWDELKEENWKYINNQAVPGIYSTYYMVSDWGRVCNFHGNIMKPTYDPQGYKFYHLQTENGDKTSREHSLVMNTFDFDPLYKERKVVVDHINGDPTDNNIKNLRYATKSENAILARTDKTQINFANTTINVRGKNEPRVQVRTTRNISDDTAKEICLRLNKFEKSYDIAKEFNTSASAVKRILERKSHTNISSKYLKR